MNQVWFINTWSEEDWKSTLVSPRIIGQFTIWVVELWKKQVDPHLEQQLTQRCVFFQIERYGSPARWASLFQHHTRACSSTGSQSWPWTLCFLDPGQRIRRRNQQVFWISSILSNKGKGRRYQHFFLNSCPLVATWSTSTEKSEPSPRPQYIRPEVIWNFKQQMSRAFFLHNVINDVQFTCDLYLCQSQWNCLW